MSQHGFGDAQNHLRTTDYELHGSCCAIRKNNAEAV
jgi:hypothetical protein